MKKYFIIIAIIIAAILPCKALARENITNWYIKNFDSYITVNKDSSLLIDEKITADCGECIDKHGIFRVLPTTYSPESGKRENLHIELQSITDFSGNKYQFQTINDRINHTITWKIGDPDKTVLGINEYEIKYKVLNGIRGNNSNFDEFYWNLNGNFWDLQTDQFNAFITFPDGVRKGNIETNLYSGAFGQTYNDSAKLEWLDDNELKVSSIRTLGVSEGITLSVTFPKGIFSAYKPTFFEIYGYYFSFLIPILVLIICFMLWKRFGKDPKINPTVVPEFEIPEGMSPMSIGMVETDGLLKNTSISATIINLAVKGALKIEEIPKKGIFSIIDYKLIKLDNPKKELTRDEHKLLEDIFDKGDVKLISDMKNEFYKKIPSLTSSVKDRLIAKKYLWPHSRTIQIVFVVVAVILLMLSPFSNIFSPLLMISLIISALLIFVFSFLMRRRTSEGAKFFLRVKGLRLYMETAEKYRQRFNEKENIFEKFLPYAIMFGLTTLWIAKMKEIYGEKYFTSYMPVWYVGSISNFDSKSFNSAISDMSSNMASTISSSPSSSGSGGGGFSGGGGGGGGGGGW